MKKNGVRAWTTPALLVLMASGLSACGGGSNDAPATASAPPVVDAPVVPPKDTRTAIQSVTVFGDSLSDVGTYAGAAAAVTGDSTNKGKFTVNPGSIWVENIAAYYGLTLSPNRALTLDKDASGLSTVGGVAVGVGTATVLGGNGYAEGGARVDALPSESGVGNNAIVAPVTQQVDHYLTAHKSFPANELVIIDGGGNDTYAQFSAVCWGTDDNQIGSLNTTIAIATDAIVKAANAQVANVKRIAANGAPVTLVAAASDWSGNPFGQYYLSDAYQQHGGTGGTAGCYTPVPAAQVTAWTNQFNKILYDGVKSLSNVVYFDAAPTVAAAVADPKAFGLVNVTAPACVPSSAAFCTTKTMVAADADKTYLWSDAFHPSPRGHQIFSDAALALLKPTTKPAN